MKRRVRYYVGSGGYTDVSGQFEEKFDVKLTKPKFCFEIT